MNLAWRKAVRDSRLDTTARAVAFALDTYADRNGLCWPGLSTIARGAGLNETNKGSVVQAIRRLEAAGFLTVSRSKRASKKVGDRTSPRDSNTYLLRLPTVLQPHPDGAAATPSTVRLTSPNGVAATPEAGSNQPVNQSSERAAPAAAKAPAKPEPASDPDVFDDEPGPDDNEGHYTRWAREHQHILKEMP